MKHAFLTSCAAGAMLVATSGIATAATTQDFTVDWGSSSVSLTQSGGLNGGINCFFSDCGVSVSLSGAPTSFTLGEGVSTSFDFLRWTGTGTTGDVFFPNDKDFTVQATLAFAPPVSQGTSSGSGGAHIAFGSIIGGNLTWDSIPRITAANGSIYDLSFQGGSSWLIDGDTGYTSQATVGLVSAVPLPAAGPLLLAGLGLFGFAARRRKNKKAA